MGCVKVPWQSPTPTKISKIITKAVALQLMSKDYFLVREENCRKKKP